MLRRMDTHGFDVVVVGAGIAGATAAAHLAADRRVALIEAEDAAGYHATGRSSALWILNYGPPDVRVLTGMSKPFLEAPPQSFVETPILSHRAVVHLAPPEQEAELRQLLAGSVGMREASVAELSALVPALKPNYAAAGAIEEECFSIDVAALHQGYLRQARAGGGVLALRSRAGRIERRDGVWHVEVTGGALFTAPLLVDAAGAWGDEVAKLAGVSPLGLSPKRRTIAVIDAAPWKIADWPAVNDVGHSWYCLPTSPRHLLVSPADETDMHPHDVQPEALDIAIAIDRMQQALNIEVRRVERSWAGLRTFTPDRSLAIGRDGTAEGFFWCVGQGGFGIQTSKAAGQLLADLVNHRDPGEAAGIVERVDPRRFAAMAA
ncbi:D-arginine dehydrogenase [Rhizobiales bacterium GAS188]|nr:D-arginine dehydrogenase [Rhizobiales bacterium GAS188]